MSTALITGITGQDGSYLAELLLSKGYRVIGMARRASTQTYERIQHLLDDITVIQGDLTDQGSLLSMLEEYKPDEIYNLAAQSFVPTSWNQPVLTGDVTALGVTRLWKPSVSSIRRSNFIKPPPVRCSARCWRSRKRNPRLFIRAVPMASPRPMVIGSRSITANPLTCSRSPASSSITKARARGLEFVTRKVSDGAVRIKLGLSRELHLGNLELRRDWGFAGDYVKAMWLMLQQDQPDNYVVGTGETHSVREFCELAFDHLGLDYNQYVVQDTQYYRPAEVDLLVSDPRKAGSVLGWEPTMNFGQLVYMMVDADMERLKPLARN